MSYKYSLIREFSLRNAFGPKKKHPEKRGEIAFRGRWWVLNPQVWILTGEHLQGLHVALFFEIKISCTGSTLPSNAHCFFICWIGHSVLFFLKKKKIRGLCVQLSFWKGLRREREVMFLDVSLAPPREMSDFSQIKLSGLSAILLPLLFSPSFSRLHVLYKFHLKLHFVARWRQLVWTFISS